MNSSASSIPSTQAQPQVSPPPLAGADVIRTLAHHLRSLSVSAAASAAAQGNNTKNGNGSIVASLLSFTTRRSTATSVFQRDPRSLGGGGGGGGGSVPILTPPTAPPSAGRFAPRPMSIVASTIQSHSTAAAHASRYEASLAPMNTVGGGGGGGSTMIPGPTTRLTLDPMHLAYLENRFRTSPRVRKYLGLPPMPSSGTSPRDASGGSGGGWGIGSWFGGGRSASSHAVSAAEDQQLLYIFQCFEQLRSLRLTPVAKRPIADWSPTSASTTSLHNLTSVEFKGVLPSSVDLTELSMQITVLVVQSQVESLDQVLTYPSYTRLSLLDLSSNSLTATDAAILARAPHLADLILHANQLCAFPDISPLAHLTHLDLSFNQLTSLPPASATPHVTLQRLNLHANNLASLTTLPTLFPSLIQLVASKNHLDHIPPLSQLASLADVQLWGNPIQEADDAGYRVQIAAQFLDRVAHVVVDGHRLVPLPGMPGNKHRAMGGGVKARVVKLDGDGDARAPRSPTSPTGAGKRSPLASQVDLARVKEEGEEDEGDRVGRHMALRQPMRTNSDPTMRRTTHAQPAVAPIGGGTTAADAALAEERIRRKIDELKKQGGAQNWMRQMVSEAAGRQRVTHAATSVPAHGASASATAGDGTSGGSGGRLDGGARTPTSGGVAGGLNVTGSSPIHRPRSTGSLRHQGASTLTPPAPAPTNTPSPRHGHGRKPSTTVPAHSTPPSQPSSTESLPTSPSSPHTPPTPPPSHTVPTLDHADSALATTPPRPPPLHAHIAHHPKPRLSPSKRAALAYTPLPLSDSLAELPLADTIAARVTSALGTCWAQLTCRATRATGIAYVTVRYEGERAADVAARWAHVLAREVKANQARGHVADVCPRGECVVCGVSGWVPDHVGKRRKADGAAQAGEEAVAGEVDARSGGYLDVRVREKGAGGAKGQVECAKCGTVVAVYFGTSLEP